MSSTAPASGGTKTKRVKPREYDARGSFLRQCWYVAGFSGDFRDEPKSRTMLGQHIVLFRGGTGVLAALEDECPHRRLPLSLGKIVGENLQCGYHGLTFSSSGQCVRAPGQNHIPNGACVRQYPVAERNGVVWVWMGDADRADPATVFDLPAFHEEGWAIQHGGEFMVKANYLMLAENLCDPAHVTFVHPTTLGSSASEDMPVNFELQGDVVVTYRWIRNAPPIGFFREFGNFSGNVDRWHYYYYHSPGTAVVDFGSADTRLTLPESDRAQGLRLFVLHFVTPIDEHCSMDYWMHLRNFAINDKTIGERMNASFRVAYAEDTVVLEAIEKREAKPRSQPMAGLDCDKGVGLMQRVIHKRLREEAAAG